jgi:hypothetical protein
VSTTIGGRGASVNLGKNGTYLNTSIPGTGMYNRHKISEKSKTPTKSSYASSNVPPKINSGVIGCIVVIMVIVIFGAFISSTEAGFITLAACMLILAIVSLASENDQKQQKDISVIETDDKEASSCAVQPTQTKSCEIQKKFDNLDSYDPLFEQAARMIVINQECSTSMIQRKFSVGYARAGQIMDKLEKVGIVGPIVGSSFRKVLIADENKLDTLLAALGQEQNDESQELSSQFDSSNPIVADYRNRASKYMTESYFNDVNNYVSSFIDFADELAKDEAFRVSCNNLDKVSIEVSTGTFGKTDPKTFKGKLLIMMVVDMVRNFEYAGHGLNLKEKEQFGILLYMIRLYGSVDIKYEYLSIYEEGLLSSSQDLAQQMLAMPEPEGKFLISFLLRNYSDDLVKKYHIMLYRIISLTAKCDGVVTEKETQWMNEVMALGEPSNSVKYSEPASNYGEADGKTSFAKLDELIGLTSVKQEVNVLANLIKIQQKREEKGLKVIKPSYHCVFTGNPGTGKTTVARILAGIYHELGILKKGQLVETDRSGLVAEYVGQTAVKTNKIIDKALDGVLFVDEAYTLVNAGENDYGREAIATLLKRMEDDRERLVVILAGYTNEMKKFIDSNPGLQSRFSRYINFPDYSEDELMQIFESSLNKYEYTLSADAKDKLTALFVHAIATKDENFGNGRYVRNVFDKTIERQSNRLAVLGNVSVAQLSEITSEDIPS